MDFAWYWEAGRLALAGRAADAYRLHASPLGEMVAMAYPPPFLFVVAPLGLVAVLPALFAWLAVSFILYLVAARRWPGLAVAHPPAAYNALVGQNGFLSAAATLFGAVVVDRRPWLGGALLGLLSLKPQLALLVPVALVAGRHWRALLSSVLCAAALYVLAAAAFGLAAYRGFFDSLLRYGAMMESGEWAWTLLASPYGFVRWWGGGSGLAWLVQVALALGAAAAVGVAWRRDWETKAPILAAGTLLVSPYLFTYDAVMLVAAFGALAARRPGLVLLAWGLTLPPFAMAVGPYAGPNTIPLAALLCLGALCLPSAASRPAEAPAADRGSAPRRARLFP